MVLRQVELRECLKAPGRGQGCPAACRVAVLRSVHRSARRHVRCPALRDRPVWKGQRGMELKPKRFLVLDDQLVLRKLISRQASFFTRFAVEIDEFSDPAEALRSIAEGGYHLVITDIGMPGMNGIDFIKNVARLGYQSALLIISGYDGKTLQTIADMSVNLGLSCTRFLSKPYSAEAFVAALNGIFSEMERSEAPAVGDVAQLLADLGGETFRMQFAPVRSLAGRRLAGFTLRTLQLPDGRRLAFDRLLALLAGRRMASAALLEIVVERTARLLQDMRLSAGIDDCRVNIRIDEACLSADNVFDRCFMALQQSEVSPACLGFALADGLNRRSDALCFENIAKVKYLGFRLLADGFGQGSLTVSNLFRLPFDQVNAPLEALQWMKILQGEDPGAFRLLRSFGLGQAPVCATGLDDEESLALAQALGCGLGEGDAVSLAVPEEELLQEMAAVPEGGPISSGNPV
ncbi:EAL domain-containing protein [Chromobacterium violaceum]|uniref:EAL domain-containing response regulator n=2 Tax=Chromobacterium violaceum TaxID=536 RepID=UPI0009BA2E7A|nr:EAL domain-containing protein [Chromobacterium violaceum]